MRSPVDSVKLRSPGLLPAILAAGVSLGLGSGLVGCIIDNSGGRHRSEPATETPPPAETPEPTDTPLEVAIDADQALESVAGDGVGVFVEYVSGGHWHVWTSCDTNSSEAVCSFDTFVSVAEGGKITGAKVENLETSDIMEKMADSSLHLSTRTSAEFDGMTFDTEPGAVIQLEAYFDDNLDPRIIYWLGDGVLHQGAPSNPIQFKPSSL